MSLTFSDKIEIDNLLARYARYVDQADYVSLGRLFVAGKITANVRSDPPIVGEEAVRTFYSTTNRTHADGTARTHHIVTNLEYRWLDSGCVQVDSCFTVFQATETLLLQPIVAGRYNDVFRKIDGAWHFEVKHIIVTHLGELSEHLTISLGP